MSTRVLARSRARLTLALTLLGAAALAGCTAAPSTSSSVTATGKTLTIYLSAPAGGDRVSQDVVRAERLAFQQAPQQVSGYGLRLRVLQGTKLSDSARTAIQDTSAIAYLGELMPGSSADSLGITNAQDLLQVSPTDTALELTQSTTAVPGAPGNFYEQLKSYGRTFARVTPTTAQEARALVGRMRAQRVTRLALADDGSDYGRALAAAVRGEAGSSVTVSASPGGADGALYAGRSSSGALRFLQSVRQSDPRAALFAPSALATDQFASAAAALRAPVLISAPGFLPGRLPAQGAAFERAFRSAYGHAPSGEAVFGYEAMSAVLAVLAEAGASVNKRGTVVRDFFAIKNRSSPLGTYSINANGDTSIAPFVFSRATGGRLTPFLAVSARG